jgi:REP element-mobilizing transposase RayT
MFVPKVGRTLAGTRGGSERVGMGTKLRIEVPGGLYHVNANALHSMALFRDEFDRLRFLELLADQVEKSAWTILMYSLMTTHYHVLFRLEEPTLSSGFQRLQSLYARGYNRRHKRRGVVWQKKFHDEFVESEGHLYETIRYIAHNATRANICERPEEWPWCSYGSAIGLFPPDPLVDEHALLALFGPTPEIGRRRLQEYVEEKNPRERWRQRRL